MFQSSRDSLIRDAKLLNFERFRPEPVNQELEKQRLEKQKQEYDKACEQFRQALEDDDFEKMKELGRFIRMNKV